MWSPEIKEHFNSNYQRIRKENNLKYGESDFLTLGFINEPPCFPAMEKKDLLTALSAPETSINRTILNDQLKGILDQVTLMARALAKAKDTPVAKAALFVPNVKEESSSVIDLMDENKANVSLQVAGKKYLFEQNNKRGLLLPKQRKTIAELPGSKDLEKILPSDQEIIANQNLTGAKLRKGLPKFALNLNKLFIEKRLYENQVSSQNSAKNSLSIITQMQDSKSPTLILKVKKGELDSLFISPTFDYNNDNTFFMLCAQS
ncbi:MAG: hypothetical protein KGO93_04935 [Cyanobacteria bacterium REEB446]|nr:hypothetical protein [Cyanobacteria bacterium REEB446]